MPDRMIAAPSSGLGGSITVPGDKSLSHRALILAAMADGESRITDLSEGEDVLRTWAAVAALGTEVERIDARTVLVHGAKWRSPDGSIDCGNSGTAARLLIGAVAGQGVTATFTGDASLSRRPMARLTAPLRAMGMRIEGGPTLPLTVAGGPQRAIRFVNRYASAQVKSAILLAGLGGTEAVEIVEPAPSRDHSERMLRLFGVSLGAAEGPDGWVISLGEGRRLRAADVEISGDPSSAAFPLVAALTTEGSKVMVRNVLVNPLRTGLFETLREMGADLSYANPRTVSGEPVADIVAASSHLRGVTINAERAPAMIDEFPILAVAAACAEGQTVMRGLGELRHKESDRIAAIAAGLEACGIAVRTEGDDLIVRGGRASGAKVRTEGDHRIAMSFLTLGLAAEGPIEVDRAAMIATSFPGFADTMCDIGADIRAGE